MVTEDIQIRQQSKFNLPHSASPRHTQAESLSFGKTHTKQQTRMSHTFPPDTPFLMPATIKPQLARQCTYIQHEMSTAPTGKIVYLHPTRDVNKSLHYSNCTVQSNWQYDVQDTAYELCMLATLRWPLSQQRQHVIWWWVPIFQRLLLPRSSEQWLPTSTSLKTAAAA